MVNGLMGKPVLVLNQVQDRSGFNQLQFNNITASQRNPDGKATPLPHFAFDLDLPMVSFQDSVSDGQTQAMSFLSSGEERFENFTQIFRRNPFSRIIKDDTDSLPVFPTR